MERRLYRTPKIHYDKTTLTGRPFYYFAYGAACTAVAIDTLTGEPGAEGGHPARRGRSINPAIDIGQIEGGFVQGMGWLTTEQLVWNPAITGTPEPGVCHTTTRFAACALGLVAGGIGRITTAASEGQLGRDLDQPDAGCRPEATCPSIEPEGVDRGAHLLGDLLGPRQGQPGSGMAELVAAEAGQRCRSGAPPR